MTADWNSQAKFSTAAHDPWHHHTACTCLLSWLILVGFWGGLLGFFVWLGCWVFFSGILWHIWVFFCFQVCFFFLESRSHCPKHHDSSKISLSMSHSMGSPPQSNGSYIREQLEGDTADGARTQAEEQTASPYSKCPKEKKNPTKQNPKIQTPKQPQKTPTLLITFTYEQIQHHCLL